MKQLLQCKNEATILALNERAFVFFSDSNRQVELMPVECSRKDLTENPINAVAIEVDDSDSNFFWCAVSREDKTLLMYRVENAQFQASSSDQTDESKTKVQPATVHNTPKRIGCLCFARVPEAETNKRGMMVLLAGDFAGDAWAFPLEKKEEDKSMRLLLGHTASMLTGLKCQRNVILTSDRDEKVRVTSFPDTAIIQGFLLGHAAYVSALDVPESTESPICVTCSGGDGTVRVWDYESMKQLVSWSANGKTESESAKEENDDNHKRKTDDEEDIGPDDNSISTNSRVPSRVAMDHDGEFVAVTYDQCKTMDILRLQEENGERTLTLVQSIECTNQPLCVCFTGETNLIVTMKDSSYLQVFHRNTNSTDTQTPLFESVELPPGLAELKKVALDTTLKMPESVLEKDKQGNPTMQKLEECRGGANAPPEERPWNRSERIDIAKERNKRHKRRRLERKQASNASETAEA